MGRHESFDVAVPLIGNLLSGTMLAASITNASTSLDEAPTASPDTELLDLERRWIEAEAAYQLAADRFYQLDEATDLPEPDALFQRAGDETLGLSQYLKTRADERRWYALIEGYGDASTALRRPRMRAVTRPVRPEDGLPKDAISITRGEPWPEAQARADEIVTAWDTWREAIAERQRAPEYVEAKAEMDRLSSAASKLETAIEQAAPRTIDGLGVKARHVQSMLDRGHDITEVATSLVSHIAAVIDSRAFDAPPATGRRS